MLSKSGQDIYNRKVTQERSYKDLMNYINGSNLNNTARYMRTERVHRLIKEDDDLRSKNKAIIECNVCLSDQKYAKVVNWLFDKYAIIEFDDIDINKYRFMAANMGSFCRSLLTKEEAMICIVSEQMGRSDCIDSICKTLYTNSL